MIEDNVRTLRELIGRVVSMDVLRGFDTICTRFICVRIEMDVTRELFGVYGLGTVKASRIA